MTDFGHFHASGPNIRIDRWGAGPFLIDVGGRMMRFEDSDMFGPQLLNKAGDSLKNPLPHERHPFWRHHAAWVKQGRKVADDGVTCIVDIDVEELD